MVTGRQNRSSSLQRLAVVNTNVSVEKKDMNMSRRRGTPSLRKPGALCLCIYKKISQIMLHVNLPALNKDLHYL